jgi:membrane-bound lytic murein transglycosylase B
MSLNKERKDFSKRLRKQKTNVKLTTILSRSVSAVFAAGLTLSSFLPATLLAGEMKPLDTHIKLESSDLKLDTASQNIVTLNNSKNEIIVGESSLDKSLREKAEREAVEAARIAALEAARKAEEEQKRRETVSRENRKYTESDFSSIYQAAGETYAVDPILLNAVHIVETGASGSTSRSSYAGAVGPMQFLPSTWKRYGVDGNGDGRADITNVHDAIFSAARYLKACGYPDVKKALWGYNPSTRYYNKVMSVANNLGM